MSHSRAVLVALLLGAAGAVAQDKAGPGTPQRVADDVLAAWRAKDAQALKALAEKDEPDPWLVADELCFRREFDAAAAFAGAAPRPDTERLPGYVASQRGLPPNARERRAMSAATIAMRARDPKAGLAALEPVREVAGDVFSVLLLRGRADILQRLRRLEESAATFRAAADLAEHLGWLAAAALTWNRCGVAATHRSDWEAAAAAWERRLAVEEARGSRAGVAQALLNIGSAHLNRGAYANAVELLERALREAGAAGDAKTVADSLANLGLVHHNVAEFEKARGYFERALAKGRELGDRPAIAGALTNLGLTLAKLGDLDQALAHQRQALALMRETGNRRGEAAVLGSLGNLHQNLGEHTRAIEYQRRSLALREALGDRAGVAATLGNLGIVHKKLGEYSQALAYQERSLALARELGYRASAASSLLNLGNIHSNLGAPAKARACLRQALAAMEEIGDRAGVATAVASLGVVHHTLGEYGAAGACAERALALARELGFPRVEAEALRSLGAVQFSLGNHAQALAFGAQALALREELGDRAGVASLHHELGIIHLARGDHAKAVEHLERARASAAEIGAVRTEVSSLWGLTGARFHLGQTAAAVRAARQAVGKLPLLVRGLGDEQGAAARDAHADLLSDAVGAAIALGDLRDVWFFIESGRAGSLLESLGGGRAVREAIIPEHLRADEHAARRAVAEARARLGHAHGRGGREAIRAARAGLDTAQQTLLETVARIQRTAKAAADVAYPRAAPLEEIQARLAPFEAMVSYADLRGRKVALVVTGERARIVRLAKVSPESRLAEAGRAWANDVARLRKSLTEPLRLGAETKRLLVSPVGALCYLPFGVLAADREVVYVPSGTTHGVLLESGSMRGKGVLAVGDPAYGPARARLPATRAEAEAVGDVVLLGEEATRTRFLETIRGREGAWRAVHLACHGLVDPARPRLSALALAPEASGSDRLTVQDVFRLKIPADLVVLSACETAKGKVYRAEGVIGLTRAFIMAGAPRVLVSLWKVDDAATRALMVKFYELWKKHPTATALKKAQEHVASQDKWKHPYYWAAWQLWGLGD